MVGVGWSSCAGGGARRRWVSRPNHSGIVQFVGSGSFTKWRRGSMREEFGNGAVAYLVHALWWAKEVQRGWSGVSGEVALGLRVWEASRVSGEANRTAGVGEGWLGWAGRGGQSSGGLAGGGALDSRPMLHWLSAASVRGWGKDCSRATGHCRHGREGGRAEDLTMRGSEHARGLGERRCADQGRTHVCFVSTRVLARVVTRPCLLLPWSVHKTSSPSSKLLILCGGQRIWPTGSRDMEHSSRICLTARAWGKSLVLSCLGPEFQCHL
jgi:hypothetical protein